MRFSILVTKVILAALLWALNAWAEEAPSVTPPMVRGSTEVPYPRDAHGAATVLLELVVDKEGRVVAAAILDGGEPFAEQARAGALTWEFVPARRGEAPVAVQIRARVEFHEPQLADASNARPNTGSQPDVQKKPSPAPALQEGGAASEELEVSVSGTRAETGQTTLAFEDIRQMPGAFGDPFRAIEALPGVTPIVSGLPYFYIQGAPPNDNGYFIDGIRVPMLFHVGIGQGVIHPALLDRVDLYPGVAPASFGRVAGATIAGQTRAPAAIAHGEANLRLFDVGTLLETPFADGRGSALIAGRYGYPGPIVSAITPSVKLGYWDYQTRVPRVEIVPGVRIDVFESRRQSGRSSAVVPALDPRLTARIRLARDVAWLSTFGVSHRYLRFESGRYRHR